MSEGYTDDLGHPDQLMKAVLIVIVLLVSALFQICLLWDVISVYFQYAIGAACFFSVDGGIGQMQECS
ncbi:unnamed protein product [Calypogeia fissa]